MTLTNKLGLPEALVRAVKNDPYDGGGADYSATTLLKPCRIVALERQHRSELSEDVSNRIYSLLGQITHGILERAGEDVNYVVEERFFGTIGEVSVSAQIDLFIKSEKHLQDYKLLSAYKVKNGQPPREYVEQLNIQAFLMRLNGIEVEKASLVCLLRDWSKLQALREASYPQAQVVVVPIPLWTMEEQLEFLERRISQHEAAKVVLPECTPDERWARGDTYAVMKNGRKSAVKLVPDYEAAHDLADALGSNHSVVKRPGVSTRCEQYCQVKDFCSQYKKMKAEEGDSNE